MGSTDDPSVLARPSASERRYFNIEWGGEATLSINDIWPDGNAPESPTRDDVIAEMQKAGNLRRLASEWNLDIEGVEVDGKDCGLR